MNADVEDDGDELLEIAEDHHASTDGEVAGRPWRILIVDDDRDVHGVTTFALGNSLILGRPIEFLHAYSAAEARELLGRERDIAAILLDVVMERDDAGLELVRVIRGELSLSEVRIVLRTGQPGYAPEMEAIRDYDINDYKTKSELTRTRLYTVITAALRSYDQIRAINASRRGLDRIVRASGELMGEHGLQSFAAGVIAQVAALLDLPAEGLACARQGGDGSSGFRIVAAAGRHAGCIGTPLPRLRDARLRDGLEQTLRERSHAFAGDGFFLYLAGRAGEAMAIHLEAPRPLAELDRRLLDVFCSNLVVGLDNVALFTRLNRQAYFDGMLGCPNRAGLIGLIDGHLGAGSAAGMALAVVDLDHFAETNAALGHAFGDRLLKAVYGRLLRTLGGECTVGRLAGDSFGIVGPEPALAPERLTGLFAEAFAVDGDTVVVTVTLGLLQFAEHQGSGSDALKNANLALKQAKSRSRGGHVRYTRAMGEAIGERVRLLNALRRAREREQLSLVYQPQIDLVSGRVIGAEALLRWSDDQGRNIPPDRFIPLAEHSGLIVDIGDWVLRTALRELRRWQDAGHDGLRMAVNVSVAQFRHPDFLARLGAALAETAIDPARVELEITESMAMEDVDFIIDTLDAIKRTGVGIAIDDFGTGFSSLSYLQRLNIDRLKIDRAFVGGIGEVERGERIARLVIDLGRNLGLAVIAEGVENATQVAMLRDSGCHEAQGFHYSRPLGADAMLAWIAAAR